VLPPSNPEDIFGVYFYPSVKLCALCGSVVKNHLNFYDDIIEAKASPQRHRVTEVHRDNGYSGFYDITQALNFAA